MNEWDKFIKKPWRCVSGVTGITRQFVYKHDAIDIADLSSIQDVCHMNFIMDLVHRRVSSLAVCMSYELSNGPRSP